MKKAISVILVASMLFSVILSAVGCADFGCADSERADSSDIIDLMGGIEDNSPTRPDADANTAADADTDADTDTDVNGGNYPAPASFTVGMTDFALRLLSSSHKDGENTLVSPLSVIFALAMTANGAVGETKSQMETVLGSPVDTLNPELSEYVKSLPEHEKYKLRLANSIWFTNDEGFTVNRDFLELNAGYYGADVYRAPFNDDTCREINGWVKEKTDGMIPEILDKIPEGVVMYLVNALAFEAEWASLYEEEQMREGKFRGADGKESTVDFMHSVESFYLEDGGAVGFIKYFSGRKYAYAAILPEEGVTPEEYLSTLTGEKLAALMSSAQSASVYTAIPVYETEYSAELSSTLKEMGMPLAFDPQKADFSALGTSADGNISISRVLHKTFITVGPQGVKAGAATVVEEKVESETIIIDPKEVTLDRPFIYMLIDCEMGCPFFIGIENEIG